MDTSPFEEIAELQAIIARLQHEVAKQESKNKALRGEIEAFARRYRRSVHHIYSKVEATRQRIADLKARRRSRFLHGTEDVPRYSWERPQRFTPPDTGKDSGPPDEDLLEASQTHLQEIDLKQLYRKLARRFHPDLVLDEAERQRRNRLMSIINAAYAAQDVATLLKVDRDDDTPTPQAPPLSPEQRRLRDLRQKHRELELRLEDLKMEHTDLMLDPLLELKIEEKLARARGRNLLKELADELSQEYRMLSKQLKDMQHR